MSRFLAIVGVLVLWSIPAASQPLDDKSEDGVICIGGKRWIPSLAESGSIESEPVPSSFRSLLEPELPCVRMMRNEFSLIDWHLRFGSEQSIEPALEYVERYYLREIPSPEHYVEEISQAWRDSQDGLAHARSIYEPQGPNRVEAFRLIQENAPFQEFERLGEEREQYVALAEQFLSAAEEFGSRELLEEAERHVHAAVSGYAFLMELEGQRSKSDDLVRFDLDNRFLTDEVEMRAAVLRARLDRTERAVEQAEAVLRELEPSYYDDLAVHAFTGGDDFCDIGSDFDQTGELRAACKAMQRPQEQVFNYMRSRAMLDLVTGDGDPDSSEGSYWSAIEFLAEEKRGGPSSNRSRCCRYSTGEDLWGLHLARAEYHRQLLGELGRKHRDYARHLAEALAALQAAERLAPPFEAPSRFRRVAEAWLDVRQLRNEWLSNERQREEEPVDTQFAAYLTRTLASLDSITAGQGG